MAVFTSHNDQQLGSFSTKNALTVHDTIFNGIVYEPLASSNN